MKSINVIEPPSAVKSDDATITGNIIAVDNSLVQKLKIERHTGAIEYES